MWMKRRRVRRVEELIEKHWWEGFWSRMNGGRDSNYSLYAEGPGWQNTIANTTYTAGFERAQIMIDNLKTVDKRTWVFRPDAPGPSGYTIAYCYAVAGLPSVANRSGKLVPKEAEDRPISPAPIVTDAMFEAGYRAYNLNGTFPEPEDSAVRAGARDLVRDVIAAALAAAPDTTTGQEQGR